MKKLLILFSCMLTVNSASARWECMSICKQSGRELEVVSGGGDTLLEAFKRMVSRCDSTYKLLVTTDATRACVRH